VSNNGPFGIDPEDFDRALGEASEGIREAIEMVGRFVDKTNNAAGWGGVLNDLIGGARASAPKSPEKEPEQSSAGVWVVYIVEEDGTARVEQAYATEIDALRAHKNNTDPSRKVRFLPYGVTVGLLDASAD